MNNKTLILIGLCICLLFTLPMVSAANLSADSDLIDNSVIGSSLDSQAIATNVNGLEHNDGNGISNVNSDSIINSAAEEGNGVNSIGAINEDNSQIAIDDEISPISSEDAKNANDRNVPATDLLGADGTGNSFSDLKILIDDAIDSGQPLSLDRDYVFDPAQDEDFINGIIISSSIVIEGNSYSISGNDLARIFVISSDNVLLIDITFKNGKTTESSDHEYNGGALYIQGSHVTIQNCNFTNNTAQEKGGAIYVSGDDCILNQTVFLDNVAHDDGAAVACYGNNSKIYDLIASRNTADGGSGNPNGGTLLITGDNIVMDKLNISNSRLYNGTGGTKSVKGGAIFLTGNNCNITNSVFTNCSVESTIVNSSGGAIYILGNNTNVVNCNFTNNSVNKDLAASVDNSSGGAIYILGNNANVVNCTFTNNSAIEDGGAIYIDGKNCTVNNTVFIGNVAHNDGGAIEWNGDDGIIYNLTAIGNYADSGCGSSKGGTLLINGSHISMDKLNISNSFVNGENYHGDKTIQGGAIALSGNYCNITDSIFNNCSVVYFKDDSNASGGALYIWGNNTNVINCNFTNNTASEDGGAMYIEGVNCTLNHTVFIGNVAHNDGGAIEWNGDNGRVYDLTAIGNYADSDEGYYSGNSSEGSSKGGTLVLSGNNAVLDKINISNSRVFANHYDGPKPLQGGAVFLTGHNCNITNSVFDNCSVNYDKDKSYGGAMYIIGDNATLINCNFTKNSAVLGAGAIYIQGSSTFLDNCNVLNNSARDAGGIWIFGKENIINNSNISYNKAASKTGNGGGVYYQGNNNTVSYSNIDHNSANNGGNVYMVANMAGGKLIGCNITNGRASNFGGGVEWLKGSKDCLIKDCYFYNDTSAGHGGGIHWNPGTNGQIDNCRFENCSVDAKKNGGAIYAGANDQTPASGTILSNSTFINCASGSRGAVTWIGDNGLIYNNTFIECGNLTGTTDYGGVQAIQIQNGKNNQIIECKFYNCTSSTGGAGIRLEGNAGKVTNITIANCTFDGCIAANSAGALYVNHNVTGLVLENNTFTNNSAPNYGAMVIEDNAIINSFVNNNFTNNTATASDGNGGAAKLKDNMDVINSTFIENSCNGSGGAIYVDGSLNVDGSSFKNNTAESGSAIYATSVTMSNSVLLENQAAFDRWDNVNHQITDDHVIIEGTFVGKDNLLNGIQANSGTFNNVTYCGINGGGVNEGTTNTDEVLSANSYNEVHQIVILEIYENDVLKYNFTTYTDGNGNYKFDLPTDNTRNYVFKIYHPEDTYYTGSEYTIEREPSELNITCENICYEQVENITFNVSGSNGTATGNITILINGTDGRVWYSDTIALNQSGEASLSLPDLDIGQYYIYATYNGDNVYFGDSENASFNVTKCNSTVEVVPIPTIIYGSLENVNITVSSLHCTGNFSGNLTINITSDDAIDFENITLIRLVVDEDGKVIGWTIDNRILPVGNYTISVDYSGNYKFNGNSSKAKFTVEKAEPGLVVNTSDINYTQTENIGINVTGVEGGEIPTGNVNVTVTNVSGIVYNTIVPISGGIVNVPVEQLPAGDYNVSVVYSGDNYYNSATATANFTVSMADSAVTVNVTNITYGDDETVKFNVTEGATGAVNITVTGDDGVNVAFTNVPISNGTVGVNVAGLAAGNYTVKVDYGGDNNYNPSSAEADFTVEKATPAVNVTTSDIDYGSTESIEVNVTGVDGGVTPTGDVTIVVTNGSGEVYRQTVPISDGVVSVDTSKFPAGDYNVTVTYNGDQNYTGATGKANFTVNMISSSVTVNVTNITYGDDETVKFNVTEGATGAVNITVTGDDGVNVAFTNVPISNGTVGVNVAGLAAGNYTVNVTYGGDNNYNPSSGKADFTVNKADSSVDIQTEGISYHDIENINITVVGVEGGLTPTGTVNVTVVDENGVTKTYTDLPVGSDGKVTVPVKDLPAGNYNITVDYSGDENYNPSTAKDRFTVSKINTPIDLDTVNITYGDDETITVTVPDDATGNVTITIMDNESNVIESKEVPIIRGTAELTVPGLNAGNYTVHVEYLGDNNYLSNSTDGKFEVAKADAIVEIHVYDIIYGDIEKLTVTCNAPGNVTIYVNGANVTLSLEDGYAHILFANALGDYSGKAQWDLENLAVGTYPASVHYNGNENYNEADDSDEFEVIKKETSITVSVDDIKVGENAVINVELSPGAAPGEITITVDGKEYKVNHTNGKAVLKVPGLKAGKHNVTVSYPGSQNYTNSSNETTFTVSKNSPEISAHPQNIKVDEKEKITVSVPKDATGTVTITVNGKNYTAPVKDGKAVFSIPGLKAGNYTVQARYNGDDKYLPANCTAKFTVSKVKPDISTSAPTIKVGQDGKITVTVPKDATGKITIEIDGKNYTALIKDGKAVFVVSGLKVGKHPIKVYYTGDDKYESSVVDGGYIKVIEDNGHNGGHGQKANGINLSAHPTGNPVLALLLVLSVLGFIPLGRKKDDEEDEDENP